MFYKWAGSNYIVQTVEKPASMGFLSKRRVFIFFDSLYYSIVFKLSGMDASKSP